MKRITSVLIVMMLVLSLFAVTACSSGDVQVPTAPVNTLIGSYKLTSMTSGGKTYEGDKLNSTGVSAELVVKADNTATFTMTSGGNSDVTELKVDTEKKTMTPTDGSSPASYTLEGNKLTLFDDDMTMVFTKQ